jgi:putative ABC transport system permease protein
LKFTLFDVAKKNLKRRAFRTLVLVFSMGLLVSLLVFGLSFMAGVKGALRKASDRLGADVLVVPMGARDYAEEFLLETQIKTFYMDRSMLERVKKVKGVEDTTYHIYLETIQGACCDVPMVKVVAFNQDTDFIVKPWLDKKLKRKLRPGEAIIGWEANENLGLLEFSSSVLFNTKFDFVGVLEKTGTGLDNAIFIGEENLDEIISKADVGVRPGQISLIFTKISEGLDPYVVGGDIENEMPDVDVISRSQMGRNILANLKDINMVFLITISIASVLSVFLAWTVFTAIVNERAREIGIMRALGAREADVVRLFVLEVLALGVLGSVLGIALGSALSSGLSDMFSLLRATSSEVGLPQRAAIAAAGVLFGVSVSLVGSMSSILRISKLNALSLIKEV